MPDAAEKPNPAPRPGPADPPPTDLTGRVLGEFQILRRLGAGGMGQVYLARQLSLKRQVALKLLLNNLADNPTALKRFQAEAEAVAKLNHPNIVQVYGAGESDGLRYMALEFVDGRNLREHLARKGPPDLPIAMSIMRQVATALQKAHEQGLVHRDIKPENILVTKKVEVKVADFGLSLLYADGQAVNLTQSGVTVGTPLYLSPEQAQGRTVDHRSDIYSFGVTCYHLLAGEPPFRGATAIEVALKHLTDAPPPLAGVRPDLPPDLCGMVHKMMAKAADDRYQTAREMVRDLTKLKDGLALGLTAAGRAGPGTVGQATVGGLMLSGSSPAITGAAPTLTLTPSGGWPATSPVRWKRWAAAGLACVLAAAGGAAAYVRLHPPPTASPVVSATPPTAGLPVVQPPHKLTTARERALLELLKDRHTTGDRWTAASIELALLYLRERRLDEAQARFEVMEKEPLLPQRAADLAHFAGRLGRAVLTAYRDNDPRHPHAAAESLDMFTKALANPPVAPKAKDKSERTDPVRVFLFRHPDLAQAVSDALNRDAINTGQAKLPQPGLEALRSPRSLTKKE